MASLSFVDSPRRKDLGFLVSRSSVRPFETLDLESVKSTTDVSTASAPFDFPVAPKESMRSDAIAPIARGADKTRRREDGLGLGEEADAVLAAL